MVGGNTKRCVYDIICIMKTFLIIAAMGLAGCLSTPPAAPTCWTIEYPPAAGAQRGRVSLNVRAPFDGTQLAILRADGSLAFDAYNTFAARPKLLLKAAAEDAGLVGEIEVTRLALDCRQKGVRSAVVELTLYREGKLARASGSAAVSSPADFSAAFSAAFAAAVKSLKD